MTTALAIIVTFLLTFILTFVGTMILQTWCIERSRSYRNYMRDIINESAEYDEIIFDEES